MSDYTELVKALRCANRYKNFTKDCDSQNPNEPCRYCHHWLCEDDRIFEDAAAAIEAMVKRVKSAELQIKEYKGEADLYRDLYRSAHEAFVKELYGKHGTLANLQSLKQSPIPYNLCPNRAQDVYNLCANYPEKPNSSESPNSPENPDS